MISLPTALALLAGLTIASGVNAAIYAWGPKTRDYSPWSRRHPVDARTHVFDRAPIVGWLRLRRHAELWGRAFWLRPLAVELLCGLAYAFLYWWEVERCGYPLATCLAHQTLATFTIAASFIDIDHWVIPDEVTVPGTLLGLALAFAMPSALLPAALDGMVPLSPEATRFVSVASPHPWPAALAGAPNVGSLAIGWACYCGWCLALLPWLWLPRRGWIKATRMFLAHIARSPITPSVARLAVGGMAPIACAWWLGGERWQAVLSSLAGIAASGAVVWYVRIVGGWAMQKEAMGFGDVTLAAMLGAYLGWQAGVLVFFLAPLAAIGVSLIRVALWRERSLPFGPYLCVAAFAVGAGWPWVWDALASSLEMSWLLPAALGACLLALAPMMYLARLLTDALAGPEESPPAEPESPQNVPEGNVVDPQAPAVPPTDDGDPAP